jgi:hypothetical protein
MSDVLKETHYIIHVTGPTRPNDHRAGPDDLHGGEDNIRHPGWAVDQVKLSNMQVLCGYIHRHKSTKNKKKISQNLQAVLSNKEKLSNDFRQTPWRLRVLARCPADTLTGSSIQFRQRGDLPCNRPVENWLQEECSYNISPMYYLKLNCFVQ